VLTSFQDYQLANQRSIKCPPGRAALSGSWPESKHRRPDCGAYTYILKFRHAHRFTFQFLLSMPVKLFARQNRLAKAPAPTRIAEHD